MANDLIKNQIIIGLAVLTVILIPFSIVSYSRANRQKSFTDKEILIRLDAEENFSRLTKDKAVVDARLSTVSKDLAAEKEDHAATKKMLLQEQLVNQSLKDELQKVSRLKEIIEEDLKNALVAANTPKPKK